MTKWRVLEGDSAEVLRELTGAYRMSDNNIHIIPSRPGQPARIDFSTYNSAGITIEFVKSRKQFEVSGWFDGMVGIEGGTLSLGEFCKAFGITPGAVVTALQEEQPE
ncbi:hypothetical protein KKE60_05135 [Patescibacteria group bacterium]|nr:hypothetical protein [Patescibacteria group bacterium]